MKKIILVKTGEELKLGDVINFYGRVDHPYLGKVNYSEKVKVTEELVEKLAAKGIIKIEEPIQVPHPSRDMPYFISKLSLKTGWKYDKVAGILDKIDDINTGAALSIILREVALDLDRQYKGNIKDSKEVWAVSLVSESVFKIPVDNIKHWGTFAAFRTEEDAKKALDFIVDFVDGKW